MLSHGDWIVVHSCFPRIMLNLDLRMKGTCYVMCRGKAQPYLVEYE